jgi:nitrous oxide reductase accessory protein NosL
VRAERAARARRAVLALALPTLLAGAGCAPAGPPPIAAGAPCGFCGMGIEDRRFACERPVGGRWRPYDSIECLLRDAARAPGGAAFLADYDQAALHAAESLWVVRGDFPSPMGGGLAAFLDRAAADRVAAATRGRVGRLAAFADSLRGAGS